VNALEPYRFEPERASYSADDNREIEWNDRLENDLWCTYKRCAIMPTEHAGVGITKMEGTFCSQWTKYTFVLNPQFSGVDLICLHFYFTGGSIRREFLHHRNL